MLMTILIIFLVLALLGALPGTPFNAGVGYGPSGGIGLVLIIILIIILAGGHL